MRRPKHGTVSGYQTHLRKGEDPCNPCTNAASANEARKREAPEHVRRSRLRAKAQARAFAELARRHRDEYRELYVRELSALGLTPGTPYGEGRLRKAQR